MGKSDRKARKGLFSDRVGRHSSLDQQMYIRCENIVILSQVYLNIKNGDIPSDNGFNDRLNLSDEFIVCIYSCDVIGITTRGKL
jgi:hypothetical protein